MPETGTISTFEDRLILDAQPPIDDATLARIEACCSGPLPPELQGLWKVSFGGRLDYNLDVEMDGLEFPFSLTEIFYPGSNSFCDFWGWIEEERTSLAEGKDPESVKLDFLPFGGLEHYERLYVSVVAGPDYGAVFAWTEGMPGPLGSKGEEFFKVAPDVRALFRKLVLKADPFAPGASPVETGRRMIADVEALAKKEPHRQAALLDLVKAVVLNWREPLRTGAIVRDGPLQSLALEQSAAEGDLESLQRLAALGCNLHQPLSGGANALDHAMSQREFDVARWLIVQGLDVTSALDSAAGSAPTEITRALLRRGARVSARTIAQAAQEGLKDSARLLADRAYEGGNNMLQEAIDTLDRWIERDENAATRIEAGTLFSNLTADEMRRQVQDQNTIRAYCVRLLGRRRP